MTMLQRSFYIPETLYEELREEAKTQGIATAQLMRLFLEKSVKATRQNKTRQTNFLLKLTKYNLTGGPKNLASDHDKYTWE